jgi:predicted TIM-barrel fold metal-dependent hydrolase
VTFIKKETLLALRRYAMKKITVEEHFLTESFIKYLHSRKEYPYWEFIEEGGKRLIRDWWSPTQHMVRDPDKPNKSLDLGEGRLRDMDEAGIDMQVLSFVHPNTSVFDASEYTPLIKKTNDELAEVIRKYPKRFAGFAAVAPQDPDAAARELERAVKELGMKGLIIMGHIRGDYLDNQKFWGILATAEKLDVPIYIHPGPPAEEWIKPYLVYPEISGAMWGYAAEAGLHAMRLICSGVFDKYPKLQIILGHMGESLPYWLWRMDKSWRDMPSSRKFKKSPSQYVKDNFYITTSGMFWLPALLCAYLGLGADRILFAVDYPHESAELAVQFVDSIPISDGDKEKICHLNAERLFKL